MRYILDENYYGSSSLKRSGSVANRMWALFVCVIFITVMLIVSQSFAATLNWTGSVSNDWGTAGNWSPATAPGPTDTVTIGSAARLPVLTDTTTVSGVTINSGTLTVNANLTALNFTQTSGTLTGTGAITSSTITWSGGTMSGTGTTVIPAGGTMTVAAASYAYLDGRTITNNGTIKMPPSARIREQNSGQIVNNGTIDLQGDGQYLEHITGTVGTLTNNGLLKKSSGTGASTILSLALNNNGAIQADSGTLALSTGSFATGTRFTGAGTIAFGSGLNVIAGNPGVTLSGAITLNSTTADFGSNNITFSSLAQTSGTLTGTGAVTASTITWSGGTMSGTGTTVIPAGGTMTVAAASNPYLDGRTITNNGTINMPPSARIREQNSGLIVNNGTIDLQGDGQNVYHVTGTVGTLTNNGLLKKSSGTGASTISLTLNNNGAVQADSGMLALSTGSFATGTSFTGAGTIAFGSGLNVIAGNPGVKLLSGAIILNSTIADFGSSNITFSSLAQTSGTLTGTGAVTASTITWSGGTMSGTGTTVIPAGGTMTVAAASYAYLDGRTITNNGTIKMPPSARIREQNSGLIVNNGTIDLQGDGQNVYHVTGTVGTLTNNGLLKKSSGTGASTISLALNNNGAVQADSGMLALSTGSFATGTSFTGAGTIAFGSGLNFIAGNPGVKLLSGAIILNS
ncbi:MAG: hypothetical protein WC156_06070, partial [Pedobacter sp.]